MSAINIPGFTADASFGTPQRHYSPQAALADAENSVHPQQRQCGVVSGRREEERMISCMRRCRSNGGSRNGCWRTCCREVTGRSCCYIA